MLSLILSVLLFASCNSKPADVVSEKTHVKTKIEQNGTPTDLESPEITFKINGFSGGKASLIGMYTGQQYLLDTALIDNSGIVTFKKEEPYQPGMAFLLLPDQSYFQLLISDDQTFTLSTAKGDYVKSMQVKGSIDNQLLFENLKFEAAWQPKVNEVNGRLNGLMPVSPEYAKVEAERDALLAERKAHLDNFFNKHSSSFFSKFKLAGQNPEIRDVRKSNGNVDTTRQVYIYRSEFWDNVDFSNEWLLYTPVISNKLKKYMTELTPQVADSINTAASELSERVLDHPEYYKYIVNWITLNYNPGETTLMDGEAVYNHMVNNYFTYDRAFWSDSFEVYSLRRRAKEMELSLIGQKGQDVAAKDVNGSLRSIYEIDAPYTIVFLYNPTCDHCMEESPKLAQFYKEWKSKGVEVYAMALETNDKEWKDFIAKHDMGAWVNVFDPTNASLYGKYYVDNTPELYLLGPDKTIIAKNLDVEQVAEVIERDQKKR